MNTNQNAQQAADHSYTIEELHSMTQNNQKVIHLLKTSIMSQRKQLQSISTKISKAIQTQLPNTVKPDSRPNFHPHFVDKQLDKQQKQLNAVYRDIKRAQNEFNFLRVNQDDRLHDEMTKRQSELNSYKKQLKKVLKEKSYLQSKLAEGKKILTAYKESSHMSQIQMNAKQLEAVKKEIRELERECSEIVSIEAHQDNLYILSMKAEMQKHKKEVNPADMPVDPDDMKSLMDDINGMIEQRNITERQTAEQVHNLNKVLNSLIEDNKAIKSQTRQLKSQLIQKQLEVRKMEIQRKEKQILLEQKKEKEKFQKKRSLSIKYLLGIKPIVNKPNPIFELSQFSNANLKSEQQSPPLQLTFSCNCIQDERKQTINVVKSLSFKVKNNSQEITHLKVTYFDNTDEQVQKKANSKESDQVKKGESNIEIDLEEVQELVYPAVQNKLGLMFVMKNGQTIKLGAKWSEDSETKRLELPKHHIKSAQFRLNQSGDCVKGIQLVIIDRPASNPSAIQSTDKQWRSISEANLSEKNNDLISSHFKKNSASQIDKHLLGSRRNKMV